MCVTRSGIPSFTYDVNSLGAIDQLLLSWTTEVSLSSNWQEGFALSRYYVRGAPTFERI